MLQIQTEIQASLQEVWNCFTQPAHIIHWNFASDDWHCPNASNDLRVDGKFSYTMASKDGQYTFDFLGTYKQVNPMEFINYLLADGREVLVRFELKEGNVLVTEEFEPESQNPLEMQQQGWQAILNNFKKYTETKK